jgi:hypothetical protein
MKAALTTAPVALAMPQGRGWLEALGQWLREPAGQVPAAPLFDAMTTDALRIAASARAAWLRGH